MLVGVGRPNGENWDGASPRLSSLSLRCVGHPNGDFQERAGYIGDTN